MMSGMAAESAGGGLGLVPEEEPGNSQPTTPGGRLEDQVQQLRAELGELAAELRRMREETRQEIGQLQAEITRLDGDLDESRRLNLRAAELLDVVMTELGRGEAPGPRGEER
jgi:predicted RNase H-like nuclease (RuvC/YqgF family)